MHKIYICHTEEVDYISFDWFIGQFPMISTNTTISIFYINFVYESMTLSLVSPLSLLKGMIIIYSEFPLIDHNLF